MKTFIKALIPTLALYFIFARVTALDEAHKNIKGDITEISVQSLMLYFRYLGIILYPILLLTQLLFIVPIWNRAGTFSKKIFRLILPTVLVSLVLSAGIGYMIWDKATGISSLYHSVLTLFTIQAIYWVLNLFILYLLDLIPWLKYNTPTTEE